MTAPRVLVVDDNPMNVELASFLLRAAGMQVASAAEPAQMVVQTAVFRPHLILMDIQMPGTDGLELTRRLKADPATRHIAVVAFTAYAMKGDEAQMRLAGCDGYIAKPFSVLSFASVVLAHIAVDAEGVPGAPRLSS